jgi:hypothetical protein
MAWDRYMLSIQPSSALLAGGAGMYLLEKIASVVSRARQHGSKL